MGLVASDCLHMVDDHVVILETPFVFYAFDARSKSERKVNPVEIPNDTLRLELLIWIGNATKRDANKVVNVLFFRGA